MKSHRVAVVVSHPIQHFCPQYATWALLEGVELRVFFASKHGVTAYEDREFSRIIQWQGLTLDFPHEFLPHAENSPLGNAIDSSELSARLAEFAPDVLVTYGYSQRLQQRAVRWAESALIPIIMISDAELRQHRHWLKLFTKALLLPRWLRSYRLFLTVGDANEAYYRHYGVSDERFVRCFFPIDLKNYDKVIADRVAARQRVRFAHGIPDHHKVVLNVGKFVPWKRQRDLVALSNSLQGRHDDITVILVGTGRDESSLRILCKQEGPGGVVFAGFVSPDRLAEYYCAADVYVLCSDHERHSLAVSEAIYCGLPVVVSDRCGSYGPTDDVRLGLNGFVYRCADVSSLSKLLLLILGDKSTLARMSEASLSIGRQHQALAHGGALTQALAIIDVDKIGNSI